MKKLTILFVFLLVSATMFAQTYLDVAPGYGTLNDSIAAHQGDVIYRLQAGQWYGLNGIIQNSGFPLTIIGTMPAAGQMPAEIQTGTNPDGTVLSQMFTMFNDLTLRNLFIVNANQNDVFGPTVFWSASPTSITLRIDSCVFDPTGANMIRWATTPHPNLFMTNSQVINLGDLNSEWTGNLFDTSTDPRNGLDTLYLENNTFLSTGMLLIFNSSFAADSENVFWINHNSFIFHKLQFIWDWRMNEYFVTNNLFFDYSTSPTTVKSNVYFPDGDTAGPESRFALINQDTAYYDSSNGKLLSNRKLFVEYNSNYTDPRFQAIATTWAKTHTVNNDGVTPVPTSYLVPLMYPSDSAGVNREAQMCSDKAHFPNFYENNYWDNLMGNKPNTDPQFNDATFYKVQDSLVAWTLPTMEIAQWGFDPTKISPQPAQAGNWFWHADTSYGNPVKWPRVDASYTNSTLLTASIEGLPLGDLNWFPTQKAIWQKNQASIKQHILNENETKISVTAVNQEKNQTPIDFSLSQNYPNPFNPSTEIKYSITKNSMVTLKVYNLLGQEVATLVNQEQKPGNYIINFNASQLASGVYMYRIQSGDFSLTKKMTLLK
ncbi:MAG: T9SS type A sorting domain-containing protein [Bacteroidetes bacterium]|nr:T9SS type A sorting domain-containing protein [Bacteroidota bacterium]